MAEFVIVEVDPPVELGERTFKRGCKTNRRPGTPLVYCHVMENGCLIFGIPSGKYSKVSRSYALRIQILYGTGVFLHGMNEIPFEPGDWFFVDPDVEHGVVDAMTSVVIEVHTLRNPLP